MSGLRAVLMAVFCLSMFVQNASGQPRAGIGDRDRDRGLLGRVGARRDERLNRNTPSPATAPNPNAPLNPNAANPNSLNPNLARSRAANPAAVNPNGNPAANANPFGRVPPGGAAGRNALAPTPAPQPQTNQALANQSLSNQPLPRNAVPTIRPAPLMCGQPAAARRSTSCLTVALVF